MQLRSRYEFSAAHQLKKHPGACKNMHGHNYTLELTVSGDIDPETGMVMDFADLEALVREAVLSQLDHAYLNDFIETPSAENIARWVWQRLSSRLEGLTEVTIYELPTCAVVYRGEHDS